MLKEALMIATIATIPIAADVGIDVLRNDWLNAGGMGILAYLLYYHIKNHHATIEAITTQNKEGLIAVSEEMKGLRNDIRDDNREAHRILQKALHLREDMGS